MQIWQLLVQFIFRLTFGVALAMSLTPPRFVSSGFFRVHLWLLMGLNTCATLAVYSQRAAIGPWLRHPTAVLALAAGLAAVCYVGSVFWLYERRRPGRAVLALVCAGAFVAAVLATSWKAAATSTGLGLAILDLASSGLLLGVTLSAMLLGHWYLGTPTMGLLPLKRLVLLMVAAICLRTLVSGTGLVLLVNSPARLEVVFWIFVALRWLSGLLGTFMLALLAWYTLKVPNTQSATGILYAGVICSFIGELTSQLLTVDFLYPI